MNLFTVAMTQRMQVMTHTGLYHWMRCVIWKQRIKLVVYLTIFIHCAELEQMLKTVKKWEKEWRRI